MQHDFVCDDKVINSFTVLWLCGGDNYQQLSSTRINERRESESGHGNIAPETSSRRARIHYCCLVTLRRFISFRSRISTGETAA